MPARRTLLVVHATAATLAPATVAAFTATTVVTELSGSEDAVRTAKAAIALALVAFVPLMALAALTGLRLAGRSPSPIVARKRLRMRTIGMLGVLVLVPCAIVLWRLSRAGSFGAPFVAVQVVELAAGLTNLTLLVRQFRDGRRLRSRRLARPTGSAR